MAALDETQRWLARLITAPEGVGSALAAEGEGAAERLAALVRADRGLAPERRLDVYAHAYSARIEEALREDFGALAAALGGDAFHDLVLTYLMAHPPSRPSLREAGARLADHLATEPFAAIFGRVCPYAAELARLEWAMAEAFYAGRAGARAARRSPRSRPMHSRRCVSRCRPRSVVRCAWPVASGSRAPRPRASRRPLDGRSRARAEPTSLASGDTMSACATGPPAREAGRSRRRPRVSLRGDLRTCHACGG